MKDRNKNRNKSKNKEKNKNKDKKPIMKHHKFENSKECLL